MQGQVLIYITRLTMREWHYGWAGRRRKYRMSLLEYKWMVNALPPHSYCLACTETANRNGNFASKCFVFALKI